MLKDLLCNLFRFFQEEKKHTDDVEGSKTPKNFMYQIWYTRR